MSKYGARVYLKGTGIVLVKQTIRSRDDVVDTYRIHGSAGDHRERHVALTDNAGIAQAIRDALAGKLREHIS